MSPAKKPGRIQSTLRDFLDNEAAGGVFLMVVAVLAIVTASSRLVHVVRCASPVKTISAVRSVVLP